MLGLVCAIRGIGFGEGLHALSVEAVTNVRLLKRAAAQGSPGARPAVVRRPVDPAGWNGNGTGGEGGVGVGEC